MSNEAILKITVIQVKSKEALGKITSSPSSESSLDRGEFHFRTTTERNLSSNLRYKVRQQDSFQCSLFKCQTSPTLHGNDEVIETVGLSEQGL